MYQYPTSPPPGIPVMACRDVDPGGVVIRVWIHTRIAPHLSCYTYSMYTACYAHHRAMCLHPLFS